MDILNLPNWKVIETQENKHDYRIRAKYEKHLTACPFCQSTRITRNGTKASLVMDLPFKEKPVGIQVLRQRYVCRNCGTWSSQPIPDISANRDVTRRLIKYVGEQSLRQTFASIALKVGIAENTVRNIFEEYTNELENTFRPETPQWLGIDETQINDHSCCILSNIQENGIVDILNNPNKPVVRRWISTQQTQKIELVKISPKRAYRELIAYLSPHTKIVIDKIDVLRLADEALNRTLKSARKELSNKLKQKLEEEKFILFSRNIDLSDTERLILNYWTNRLPILGEAYQSTEAFYRIYAPIDKYEAGARNIAWGRYQNWVNTSIPKTVVPFFKPLTVFLLDWFYPFLAYFEYNPNLLNHHTECLNILIQHINKYDIKVSFDAIRSKILSNQVIKFPQQKLSNKNDTGTGLTVNNKVLGTLISKREFDFSANISILNELYESGKF